MLLVAWIFKQPAVKGKFGEWLVALCLKLGLDKNKYRILNNVMISDNADGTTQIDHVVLSPFGIFVIETKNMKGWI
ncbi:MAG: nuclease-related domain-containing protein, partial [Victivallaceae bacterium]